VPERIRKLGLRFCIASLRKPDQTSLARVFSAARSVVIMVAQTPRDFFSREFVVMNEYFLPIFSFFWRYPSRLPSIVPLVGRTWGARLQHTQFLLAAASGL